MNCCRDGEHNQRERDLRRDQRLTQALSPPGLVPGAAVEPEVAPAGDQSGHDPKDQHGDDRYAEHGHDGSAA